MASEGLSLQDVLRLARGVAADFEGVAIDGVAALDGEFESVDLLLSLPQSGSRERYQKMVRVRREHQQGFERELRAQITIALRKGTSRA